MVICGKYKNLSKTVKNSRIPLTVSGLLFSVVLFNLEYEIEKNAV